MKYLVLWCSLNCLFFINTVYSTVTITPHYTYKEDKVVNFTFADPFNISCDVTADSETTITVDWYKDSKLVKDVLKDRASFKHKGNTYSVFINKAEYSDGGNYSCKATAGKESAEETILVTSNVAVNIKTYDIVVIEEEKLRIVCQVQGSPLPDLSWEIVTPRFNESLTVKENNTEEHIFIYEHKDEKERVIPNALLVVENVTEADRGNYCCIATAKYTPDNASFCAYVRVKDKYAALWPFLGICIEVIVLCAIIIIYEKKRNKTELEESDTDQSPDQKNTPDHGKEANLRHRQ